MTDLAGIANQIAELEKRKKFIEELNEIDKQIETLQQRKKVIEVQIFDKVLSKEDLKLKVGVQGRLTKKDFYKHRLYFRHYKDYEYLEDVNAHYGDCKYVLQDL